MLRLVVMMTPDLQRLADSQAGVFSSPQAAEYGLDRRTRRALVKSGVLREIRHGICTSNERWEAEDSRGRHRIELAGALLIRGWTAGAQRHRYVGGLRTAAFLLGLPFQPDRAVVDGLAETSDARSLSREGKSLAAEARQIRRGEGPRRIDLVCGDRAGRTYRNGVSVRPAALPGSHVVLDLGVPVTTLARTAADLMREGSASDALIAADGALHLGVSPHDLENAVRFGSRWSHSKQALHALLLADALAESAAESLARWVCSQEPALPSPELQVDIFDAHGHIGRVDLLFRLFRVVLEVDGYLKYTDPWCGDVQEALRRQHAREARLRAAGWTVIRTTWHELTTQPERFVRRLVAAIAAAA